MATLWQRLTGNAPVIERRAAVPNIPMRSDTFVSTETALSLASVYRAIQIIATPISKALPLETYRYGGGLEVKIENPVIVNNPSLSESRKDFIFSTVSSLATYGEAFWFKSYDSRGQVNDLTALNPTGITPRLDGLNGMTGAKVFDYMGKTYTQRDIEHMRLFTTVGNLRGLGPIQAAGNDIATALDLRNFASTWFSSGGVPTGVLKTGKMLTKDQADEITSNWHTKQATRQLAVLSEGFDYQTINATPQDLMFTNVAAQSTQTIARLFGVPARLLLTGIDGSSDTYSNLSDEQQTFYRHTLMGYTNAIEDALSNCLPRGTSVRFNYEGLFKADMKTRWEMYDVALAGQPWLTPEEVRLKEGL
jgi:HK97 family phage portal protein